MANAVENTSSHNGSQEYLSEAHSSSANGNRILTYAEIAPYLRHRQSPSENMPSPYAQDGPSHKAFYEYLSKKAKENNVSLRP